MNVRRILTIVKLETKRMFAEPLNLIFTMLLVPVLILVMGFAMRNNYGWDENYTIFEIMVPGLLAYASLLTIYDVAAAVAGGRELGIQRRIDTTPLTSGEYVISQMISYTIKPLLQVILGLSVAAIVGFRPQNGALGYLLVLVLLVLLTFCSVGLGMITANFAKSAGAAGGLAFIFIVPQQLFATFIPAAFMGAGSFKWIFPSIYATEGLGHILAGFSLTASFLWLRLGILFGITVVIYAIGLLLYERKKKS